MVRVTSEIGRLRKVLVHEPGLEVDRMVPSMMEELLFDDILYGDRAREEHRRFCHVLRLVGIEVVDAQSLLEETLGFPAAHAWVLDLIEDETPPWLRSRLESEEASSLAGILTGGLRPEPDATGTYADELFDLPPLPNWCFQRDPQIVLGDGVIFASMAAPARHRESLLARTVFRHHPGFRDVPVLHDPLELGGHRDLYTGAHRPRLEGGDVLVLSRDVVAVGHSERTNRTAIHHLARALSRLESGPRFLLSVELPRRRAYMHLDTVLTPLDRDACLVYPPVIRGHGPEHAEVYEFDLHAADPSPTPKGELMGALRSRGIDLEPIPCGGSDPILQQREQWTDGANALALAPGVALLYDRNVGTAEELDRRGFRIVESEALLMGRVAIDLGRDARVCIVLASHEMSRARGGPHCLAHPLVREEIE